MKKLSVTLAFLAVGCLWAFSQQKIEGLVVDEDKVPLPGVSVVEKNTSNGVSTDLKGQFSFTASSSDATLVFSLIGMKTVEQKIGNSKKLYIILESATKELDQVVVIGYGSMLKKDLTGSVGLVDVADLTKNNSASLLNSLSGKVAGVNVVSSSGELGANVNITIRGSNSINAGTQPLYVIDGMLIDVNTDEVATSAISGRARFNPLAGINPADIESIQVLKDASATAIYGSAGANGVIVITTKEGARNKTNINFDVKMGGRWASKHIPMLQGQDFADYRFLRFPRSLQWGIDTDGDNKADRARIFPDEFPDDDVSHDWQKELLRTGLSQNYNLSILGSSNGNDLMYSLSGEYLKQEGIAKKNDFIRYTARYKLEYAPNRWLRAGGNGAIVRTELNGPVTVGGGEKYNGWLESLLYYKPFNFKLEIGDLEYSYANPSVTLENAYKSVPLTRFLANMFVQVKPIRDITIRSAINTGLSFSKSEEFYPTESSWGYARRGLANVMESLSEQWQSTSTATYIKSFPGGHHVNAMLGFETSSYVIANLNITAEGFAVQTYNPVFDMDQGLVQRNKPYTNKTQQTRMSTFGRFFYSYRDRYLTTLTFRRDGSSKFGKDTKYAFFPSVAFAWKIHNERFMKPLKGINELKLRLSAGSSGNDRIPPYRSLSRLDKAYYHNLNGTAELGLAPAEIHNYNLKWETTDQYDLGLDFSILKNRLSFHFDLYYKDTRDMLFHAGVPSQFGSFRQWQNLGRVENKGIELALNSINITTKDFNWTTAFNIAANRNKILSLGGDVSYVSVEIRDGTINEVARLQVGESIGSGWGYVQDGIYQKADFNDDGTLKDGVVSIKGKKVKPGDMKFKSLNNDQEIDPINDKMVISRSEPLFFGGITNTFEYKNLSLSAFFNFSYGNQVLNIGRYKYEGVSSYFNISEEYYRNHWREDNPSNHYPSLTGMGRNLPSSYYVEDASFLRLQNLTLAYRLPFKWIKPLGINDLSLSVSCDNLFVLTQYSGFDPEVSFWNKLITGLDLITYPRSKSLVFGFNIAL